MQTTLYFESFLTEAYGDIYVGLGGEIRTFKCDSPFPDVQWSVQLMMGSLTNV